MSSTQKQAHNQKQKEAKICTKCNNFWGSQAYQGMCSTCYTKVHGKPKKIQTKPEVQKKAQDKTQKYQGSNKGVQLDKTKCFKCNKKVGLLGTECKCNYVFCNLHRMPEDHICTYNYEAEGKDNLAKEIKKLEHKKIENNDSL